MPAAETDTAAFDRPTDRPPNRSTNARDKVPSSCRLVGIPGCRETIAGRGEPAAAAGLLPLTRAIAYSPVKRYFMDVAKSETWQLIMDADRSATGYHLLVRLQPGTKWFQYRDYSTIMVWRSYRQQYFMQYGVHGQTPRTAFDYF